MGKVCAMEYDNCRRISKCSTQYDRSDPAEIQELKDEVEKRNAEIEKLNSDIAQWAIEKENWNKTQNHLKDLIKTNNSKARAKATRMEQEKEALEQSIKKLEEDIAVLTAERDTLQVELSGAAARQPGEELLKEVETLRAKYDALEKTLEEERKAKASAGDDQVKIVSQKPGYP